MYVTLKLYDSGCKIHSVSHGDKEIVTNERLCCGKSSPGVE